MFIIPAEGLNLQDPDRRDRIPPEGRDVPPTNYWHRRLAEGSCTLGEAPKEPADDAVTDLPAPAPEAPADTAAAAANQEVAG